jgi:class 3 adenylate cyclase
MEDGSELIIRPGDAYEIPPGHDAWVEGEDPWHSVEFTSARTYGVPPAALGERILATLLFSDIVDSTSMLSQLGDHAWAELLQQHNERIRAAIDSVRGREMATLGDGFLAIFDGAAKAVRAAQTMAESVAELGLQLRIGIHTGELEITGGQARGVAVHTAARIGALAEAGQILVSATTCDLLDGSGLTFDDHGEHLLKGLRGKRALFLLRP